MKEKDPKMSDADIIADKLKNEENYKVWKFQVDRILQAKGIFGQN